MLQDKKYLDNFHSNYNYDFWEGIVTEVQKGGDQINVQVYVLKTGNKAKKNGRDLDGKKIWIFFDSFIPACHAAEENLKDIVMVPGRRIRFDFFEDGSSAIANFAYIKALPALKQ